MNDEEKLLAAATAASKNAYAEYSKVSKGAALEALSGKIYTAGNLEFATYGGSVCAELAALSAAVSAGERRFKLLALAPYRYPCGNCRQALCEFGLDLGIITRRNDGSVESRSLAELLPNSFSKDYLD